MTGVFMFVISIPCISAYDIDHAEPFRFPPESLLKFQSLAYWGNYLTGMIPGFSVEINQPVYAEGSPKIFR
jgi:hypothetical protein